MKSAARNVPQPFQVAGTSKWVLFEVPATFPGCGTFSEEYGIHGNNGMDGKVSGFRYKSGVVIF
jgi:hypothetical protein